MRRLIIFLVIVVGLIWLVASQERAKVPGSTKPMATVETLQSTSSETVCWMALSPEIPSAWNPKYSEHVAEAARRGLTVDACRKLIGPTSASTSNPPAREDAKQKEPVQSTPADGKLIEKWLDEFKSNRGAMIAAVAMAIGPATDICGEAKDPEILKKASVFAMTLGYTIDDAFVNDLKATMTKQIGLMNDHPEPEFRRGTCLYAKSVTGLARSTYDIQKKDHPELMKEIDGRWNEVNQKYNLQR